MKKVSNYQKEEIVEHQIQMSDETREQPDSASSLRRHIAATLFQHHPYFGNNGHAPLPPSLASPNSSIEVAPDLPAAVTSASCLEFTHQREVSYNVNTSAELLKVLNCIRSIEEQHASHLSLMKTLRKELKQSRLRIKKLLRERERDRQNLNERTEQNASDIAFRIKKEQDRIRNAVFSARDELESERKLRKHTESLHRKLARELSEVKSFFCTSLEEIERERNTRILLENLCDEFAKGITEYEQMVRSLRHNRFDNDEISKESPDRLILHISESWLDERQQMKLVEATCDPADKNTIVDRLRLDIESFLGARQPVLSTNVNEMALRKSKKDGLRRHSYESFQLNDTASAPQNGDHEEDSVGSGLNILESIKHLSLTGINSAYKPDCGISSTKSYPRKSRNVFRNSDQSSLQNQFQEHKLMTASREGSCVQVKNYKKSKDTHKGKQKQAEARDFFKGHKLHALTRHHSLSRNDRTFEHCTEYFLDHSASSSHPAIKQHTLSRITTLKPQVCELSRKGHEDNSLRAMLLEAKSESQNSILRNSKAPM